MIKKYTRPWPGPGEPIVIEAVQWGGDNLVLISEWMKANQEVRKAGADILLIATPEGVMQACVGDYIIKAVNGEFYPCKSDVFEETYNIEPYA